MKDPVVQEGASVLREKASPVAKTDFGSKKLTALIQKMKDVLAKEEFGVAIAAPQVGESLRIFVIAEKAFKDSDEEGIEETPVSSRHLVFINPELLRLSRKKHEMSEGCLSVRGIYGNVVRHEKASVKAFDENGKPFTYHGSGLIAHIFQHEVDHLNGILFIDKAVSLQDESAPEKTDE
ncbi:peptide deformylase [Candidatus Adlerbacteria bacterium RIFOXYC1_FULL_48_26]|uniref:Peptide deformylase n=1 Tax=Candidatus Adlerbacteria bacterium RIFOXYC1_FULL_48_26 TaxID=1797247 RepID=A0A1F4Y3S2_9BACT|nr:MAG: peptide deformylase [Candidatus Adlerbacteria bacterium RIFOXYC1_FULL_48_26]OGC93872.1 MAG: peptide deformylase [Candidatus Adlerbacteria bacterium RIFOXYB1_FULL_48_10]OGC94845.1 MAG: peptide deformylase [Candidatus Adlerbacteria bacterium RIFOXYD1_FULL_48_8]